MLTIFGSGVYISPGRPATPGSSICCAHSAANLITPIANTCIINSTHALQSSMTDAALRLIHSACNIIRACISTRTATVPPSKVCSDQWTCPPVACKPNRSPAGHTQQQSASRHVKLTEEEIMSNRPSVYSVERNYSRSVCIRSCTCITQMI